MALDTSSGLEYRDSVGHWNWLAAVRRGRLFCLAGSAPILLALVFATAALAAESSTDETTLVFDLAGDNAVVDQHDAQMLWNLMTDNIVPERIDSVTGWNSLFLEEPGTVSGTVVADLETGTISGEVTERWTCDNDCVTQDGAPSWTTTRDTGWTATITDGTLTPDATGWTITGSVAIKYTTAVTAIENASDCNGSPCYVCQQQLCEVGGEATATAALEGWIEGDRLSLFFADRLEADVTAMDFSDLRRIEFHMSRFLFTQTGVVAPVVAEPPPEEPTAEEPAPTTVPADDATDVEAPAGEVIPGVGAGSPPADFGDDDATDATADPGADPKDATATTAKRRRVGLLTLMTIIILIILGTATVLITGYLIRTQMGWGMKEAAADAARAEGIKPGPIADLADKPASAPKPLSGTGLRATSQPPPPAAVTPPPFTSPTPPPSGWQPPPEKDNRDTPSAHYARQPGLKSGRYRVVDFTEPVRVERPGTGTNIDLVTNNFTGPTLIGDPDPATPWYTPVFGNDGTEIGWVRTSDVPD